jgi:hypothetical protein
MLLGKFHITSHAIEQYDDRVNFKSRGDIIRSIKHDLRTLNIKNIVYKDDCIHIFTRGYKEFIFAKSSKGLYLKTIIKRNREDTQRTINKRQRELVTT